MSLTKIPFFPRNYINNCCCHSIKPFILDVVCLTELHTRFHGNVLKSKHSSGTCKSFSPSTRHNLFGTLGFRGRFLIKGSTGLGSVIPFRALLYKSLHQKPSYHQQVKSSHSLLSGTIWS